MRTALLSSSFIGVALLFTACAADSKGGGMGSGSDQGSGSDAGSDRPPFTDGVSTLGGFSDAGDVDGGRNVNLFANPVNVAYGPDGLVYVADFDNSRLRTLDAQGNAATVIDMPSTFARPFGMVFAPDGTLYVTTDNDPQNAHTLMSGSIWKVDTATGTPTVIVADIGRPRSLAMLADGRIAAADDLHDVIEIVDPATATVTTLAGAWDGPGAVDGAGTAATFNTPYGLYQQADGSLLVCDWANNELRQITMTGTVTTVAGGTTAGYLDGPMASAQFSNPQGLVADNSGNIYFTDLGNNRVRKLSAGVISTVAGNGMQGYDDSDDLMSAEFFGLEGLAVKSDGSMVYVADGTRGNSVAYNRVRQIMIAN